MHDYSQLLLKRWREILAFGVVAAAFGVGISLFFPLKYSATMRLLIIQKQLAQSDPYTAIKASEGIADNLGQIIYTTSFFDKVSTAKEYKIDWSVLPTDERKKRKAWAKTVDTQVVRGSGLLQVAVYHKNKDQAVEIARDIAYTLTTEGWQYVGGGDLQVKLVDDPLISRFPVKPNVPVNAVTGFVLGLIAGAGYVMITRKKEMFGVHV